MKTKGREGEERRKGGDGSREGEESLGKMEQCVGVERNERGERRRGERRGKEKRGATRKRREGGEDGRIRNRRRGEKERAPAELVAICRGRAANLIILYQ